jgi:hypothetical protein
MEALPMSDSCLLKNYLNLRARTGIGLHRTANLPGRRAADGDGGIDTIPASSSGTGNRILLPLSLFLYNNSF